MQCVHVTTQSHEEINDYMTEKFLLYKVLFVYSVKPQNLFCCFPNVFMIIEADTAAFSLSCRRTLNMCHSDVVTSDLALTWQRKTRSMKSAVTGYC